MAMRNIILNLLIPIVLVQVVAGARDVLPEKTGEKQLSVKGKVPAKTITTEHGDVYDCIDFYEQPAFEHHMLNKRDYHFDMKPSFAPNEIADDGKNKLRNMLNLKRVECPKGTVPIRRTTREDLTTEMPSRVDTPYDNGSGKSYYAGAEIKVGISKIHGAATRLSVDNPSLRAFDQHSSSIISIESGNEILHAGWTVHPQLYDDYNTRLYIWTHVANTSCYNVECPGFVIVNHHYPIDSILKEAEITSGTRGEIRVVIYQDKKSGNWWLAIKEENIKIGFWPKHLFSSLSEGADRAYYGGVVKVPSVSLDTVFPAMGSGRYPVIDYMIDDVAYCRRISTIDQDGNEMYAGSKSDFVDPSNPRYRARLLRTSSGQKNFESTIIFGGRGG